MCAFDGKLSHIVILLVVLKNVKFFFLNIPKHKNKNTKKGLCLLCLDQALRICLEWSSEAIYFSTHQFELIHHKINSLLVKSLRIFF